MFTLLIGLWKYLFDPVEYTIPILGPEDAGKTTWLEKVKKLHNNDGLPPEKIMPTVGLNIGKIKVGGALIRFWDLGGEKSLRPIWNKYIEDANALIYCVDASNPDKLEDAKETFDSLMSRRELELLPVLIVANKQDSEGAEDVNFIKNYFGIRDVQERGNECHVITCSAITGEGIKQGIDWLVNTLTSKRNPARPGRRHNSS